jgi:2-polyprenyl-3-methyl-5-hydroxy-6-metoxy-1,4-benzoquinol methylase
MTITCGICNKELNHACQSSITKGDKKFDVLFCNDCNVGTTFPQPPEEALAKLYSAGSYRLITGGRFNRIVESWIGLFRSLRKRRIKKFVPRGRIFDIGCGRGLFLHVMKRDGWEVTGFEIDQETALAVSKTYDIPVLYGDIYASNLPDATFDVITLNHVLEHLRNPSETIQECHRLLKQGGLLVISVPNFHSLQARAGKKVWFHLDLPYHLYHFTEKGLLQLIEKTSFRTVKKRRFDLEQNPFGWLQTLLNLSGIRENTFYDILKKAPLRNTDLTKGRKLDLFLTFSLLPLYVPLALVLSCGEVLLKQQGTLEVFALKK